MRQNSGTVLNQINFLLLCILASAPANGAGNLLASSSTLNTCKNCLALWFPHGIMQRWGRSSPLLRIDKMVNQYGIKELQFLRLVFSYIRTS